MKQVQEQVRKQERFGVKKDEEDAAMAVASATMPPTAVPPPVVTQTVMPQSFAVDKPVMPQRKQQHHNQVVATADLARHVKSSNSSPASDSNSPSAAMGTSERERQRMREQARRQREAVSLFMRMMRVMNRAMPDSVRIYFTSNNS